MPSRAEFRGTLEVVLRVLSIGVLGWMLWLSLDRTGKGEIVVSASSSNLGAALRAWSAAGSPPIGIAVKLDRVPPARQRDWLVALRSAGSPVTWSGDLPAIAIAATPVASPRGGLTILTAAPKSTQVDVIDDIGPLDSARASGGGVRFAIPSWTGEIRADVAGTTATAMEPDSLVVRRVLVIGNAGWESKFVTAALEEDGWKVDAQMHVAPGVDVTQGSVSPIDTARYAAVIALDQSASAFAGAIGRYVASGGGLILSGAAGSVDAFSQLRPGASGNRIGGSLASMPADVMNIDRLAVIPLVSVRSDVIVLDRRSGAVSAAVRRHLGGRVLQSGYVDTWRWRMAGADESVA
ncbi:MAG TPA: hypothetical protein VHM24_06880, partial [Gemmatimonadaceae bacterium]|nr:hypothetical protein [Gemmatimonadaceae bacterium]